MHRRRTGRFALVVAATVVAVVAATGAAAATTPSSATARYAAAAGQRAGVPGAIPSTGLQVSGIPLAHTSRGTVFAEEGTSRVAILSDDGNASVSVPGFDPSLIDSAYGCGSSFVVDNGAFAPVAPQEAAGAAAGIFQWRDVTSGATTSRAPASGREMAGATPTGWAEVDLSSYNLIGVNGRDQRETTLGKAFQWGYGCDETGYATVEPTATDPPSGVITYCTWSGGSGSCTEIAEDPNAYEILSVSGTTVIYQTLSFNNTTGDSEFQAWRVTKGGSPTLVYSSTDGDISSAVATGAGTAFFQEAGPTTPDPGIVGWTPTGGSATTWKAPGDLGEDNLGPIVVLGSNGPLFASVGYAAGGIGRLGSGGVSPVGPWWMEGQPSYTPMSPRRVLDTRAGVGAPKRIVPSGQTLSLTVSGTAGMPAGGVAAVDLNVTVTGGTRGGYLTVYPSETSKPTASNLNYGPGQTIANHVITKVGSDGIVELYVSGTTHVIADVSGWYPEGSSYVPLRPYRMLDTRTGRGGAKGIVPAGGTRTVTALNVGGVPGAGVDSVVVNLTDTASTRGGYLTGYPTGTSRPTVSNLNYPTGRTVAGLAILKLGTGGRVSIYTSSSSHLIADVVGWISTGGEYTGLSPKRIRDTRNGIGGNAAIQPAGSILTVKVTGQGGVPASGVKAVMLNVTVTGPTSGGYLTLFPSGVPRPTASTLNFMKYHTVANSAVTAVGGDGSVRIYVSASTHVVVDVSGWFAR